MEEDMASRKTILFQGLACVSVMFFASTWLALHRHQPANRTTDAIVILGLVTAIVGFILPLRAAIKQSRL